jgi:hypothetical protein
MSPVPTDRTAALLDMQAPRGVPISDLVATVTDPINAPMRTNDLLQHFWQGLYDRSPESHLMRLCKVLLGDAGAGNLRKRYVYQHLSEVLLTAHFSDLDRLYGAVFGLARLSGRCLTWTRTSRRPPATSGRSSTPATRPTGPESSSSPTPWPGAAPRTG